jgi:serine/threonine protein kinase
VKCLREAHLPHARDAFFREVKILARKIKGVVPLLGWNMKAPRPWYVMPFVPGGTLTRFAGRLSEAQLQNVAIELAAALAGMHAVSIAHGDIKPDNILIKNDGHLSVADPLGNGMGCTIVFSKNHGGTPGYWAPEIAPGGAISQPGDVFSFGATLYHLLTGQRPQDGMRLDPTADGYQNAATIRELISVCCQYEPNVRPTIQEILRMLRGETWVDIQAARRKQAQQNTKALCVAGGLFLLGAILSD